MGQTQNYKLETISRTDDMLVEDFFQKIAGDETSSEPKSNMVILDTKLEEISNKADAASRSAAEANKAVTGKMDTNTWTDGSSISPGKLPIAKTSTLGAVKAVYSTSTLGMEKVKVDDDGNIWYKPGSGGSYTLPIATSKTLGGVKPKAKDDTMTEPVGVDVYGGLWYKPGSGGTQEKKYSLTISSSSSSSWTAAEALPFHYYQEITSVPGATSDVNSILSWGGKNSADIINICKNGIVCTEMGASSLTFRAVNKPTGNVEIEYSIRSTT